MNNGMGQNSSGDYDQLSLAGVDFGEDYDKDHKIMPGSGESLEGSMGGNMNYQQLGVVPQGLMGDSADFGDYQQLGVVPQGMGHYPSQQLGVVPQGMGHYNQLGMGQLEFLTRPVNIPFVNMAIPGYMAYGALAAGAWYFFMRKGSKGFKGIF